MTSPERRPGERTRVDSSHTTQKTEKNETNFSHLRWIESFRFLYVHKDSAFPVCRFPVSEKPDCECTRASPGELEIANPRFSRSTTDFDCDVPCAIAPRRQKSMPVASSASGSIARTRARAPRHRPGTPRRTHCTIRTFRTRVSRRTNAHRATRTSAGDTLARPLDLP